MLTSFQSLKLGVLTVVTKFKTHVYSQINQFTSWFLFLFKSNEFNTNDL